MTPPRPSTPGGKQTTGGKQLAAAATAAIPVIMLSSLALASPAAAAPVPAQPMPQGTHGTLDSQTVLAAVQLRTVGNSIPAAVVAGSVPRAVTAVGGATKASMKAAVRASIKAQNPASGKHTVAAGDTVSAIAASYGVSTESLLSRNKLSAGSIIHPGKVLTISGPAAQGATTSSSPATSYTVRAGDTLSGIAAKHKTSLASVLSLNGIDASSIIHPGQKVKVGGQAVAAAPSSPTQQAAKPSSGNKYVIKAGDTLSAIAAEHNVGLSALASANGTDQNATIYPGKTLIIPGVSAASSDITVIAEAPQAQEAPALAEDQLVPSTFLHYTYPDAVVNDANRNKAALLAAPSPSRAQMRELVASTAAAMGVDPALAMAFAQQESGFNHQSVSPANAIGIMQVIPDAGEWASGLVGRQLNLLDPQDNVTAGVAIIQALHRGAPSEDVAIAGYYQGQSSVSVHGLFGDTEIYVAGIKANRELFR
ncbi:LysM peptidoglycan-binding domain-containing protein [Arthrobacter sp. H35-D1]|uniref:LysM peptidoglycan-binding domain-containing protein n=1 Tax=Arthrobacter sp. H35-D1 TaxID=3046202 RepID=UPI0024B94FAB|nr:LysM peptidoglycan-binding domain-containing protein [Arthrobacter sp. H35-D1]MDJ0313262.1 LysM peptidoglycan-binding domain-containing protein [Arthrobacter sp. H35-D1]